MISIRKSVDDLERLDDLKKREDNSRSLLATLQHSYAMAIHSSAHYAVEVDLALAVEFRSHLKVIEDQSRTATSQDQFQSVQASFRGELRDYRDKSDEQLKKMRKEIENATAAMILFADSVAFNGVNHQQEVRTQLDGLESVACGNSVDAMRGGIGNAISGIETSIQQMQSENQLVIAQLQDEIRVLHQQIEQERKVLYTDRASGAWNRQKVDSHIDNLLRQNQPFCLLLVWVRNYKRLETQYSRTVVEGSLKALVERFAALIVDDPVIGRWSQDQFVAVLDMPLDHALRLSSEATNKLTGPYSVQENGLAQKIVAQVTAGVIDRPAGNDPSTFHQKLEQLAGAISGA